MYTLASPVTINRRRLECELDALILPGIRGITVVGTKTTMYGYHVWDDTVDPAHYVEKVISEVEQQTIEDTIAAHDPSESPYLDDLKELCVRATNMEVFTDVEKSTIITYLLRLVFDRGMIEGG